MAEITIEAVREFLKTMQGREIDLTALRKELRLNPGGKSWDNIRQMMHRLVDDKIVKPTGKKQGSFKIITQIEPVTVFGRERRPPVQIMFPRDFETGMEMLFAEDVIIREGDLILLAGRSNYGKTTLCLNICAENLDINPVLMGNEYTTVDREPSSRFLNRLDAMEWIQWADDNGKDRFTLLPVRDDYAEHIVKDRLNIIDWINIETGEHYLIGNIMESIKREIGKGVGVIVIQKSEGADAGRGGQFTKDFADLEILLDRLGETDEVLMTIGKVKESKKRVAGRTFAYLISQGVKIVNFREIVKCGKCYGKGWQKFGNSSKPCDECHKTGFVNK